MKRVLIDQGHSRVKWCLADDRGPGRARADNLGALHAAVGGVEEVWLASVAPSAARRAFLDGLPGEASHIRIVTTPLPELPVQAPYAGLGVDRWLACNGLWNRRQTAFCLADVGTATTVDVVDYQGRHRGGWIAPGPGTALAGLAARASGLAAPAYPVNPGAATDTASALGAGLRLQQAGLIDACWLRACRMLDAPLELWLTGGDCETIQFALAVPARRDTDLVLKGLFDLSRGRT